TKRRRELAIAAALAGERAVLGMQRRDISLYIGIPFCASRCKYCSFVSHSIDKAQHLVTPYLEALSREMQLVGASIKKIGCKVKTLYIGGGTPTALSASQLKEVMRMARDNFDLNGLIEYTVEAGRPDTVDTEKLSIIREYGATRVSVNPQSMDDKVLKLMGRGHTAQDIADMVSDVRKVGGLDINMDVIAGLPGDSYDGFCDTISKVLALSPDNITVHTLAIKKGSALHDLVIEKPSGDTVARMVDYAFEAVSNAGFAPYYLYRQKYMSGNMENVGYTRRGKESVYNILIMEELQTIISLGAGGVTKLVDRDRGAITRIFNHKYPYEYNADTDKFARSCAVIEDFYNAEKE
ncbi:MAG: coproporphyrinogen dehydrogenase HemZ, partial [Clostridia bacterium]